jgi:hypothetical protein
MEARLWPQWTPRQSCRDQLAASHSARKCSVAKTARRRGTRPLFKGFTTNDSSQMPRLEHGFLAFLSRTIESSFWSHINDHISKPYQRHGSSSSWSVFWYELELGQPANKRHQSQSVRSFCSCLRLCCSVRLVNAVELTNGRSRAACFHCRQRQQDAVFCFWLRSHYNEVCAFELRRTSCLSDRANSSIK